MTTLGTTPYKSTWNFEIKTLLYELGTISKKKIHYNYLVYLRWDNYTHSRNNWVPKEIWIPTFKAGKWCN